MPSSFKTPLRVEAVDGKRWKLLEPFEYYTNTEGVHKGEVITVPKGFCTDFASIPKLFWSLVGGPTGRYSKSAVIHDYLYYKQIFPRKKADLIFLEGMKVLGVPWWKRRLMYRAVRLFAWIPWKHHKDKFNQ